MHLAPVGSSAVAVCGPAKGMSVGLPVRNEETMALGKSIQIYLDGGEISGIRHAELANWTGQALLCPRNRVAELAAARWQAVVCRPGVYFLLGAEQGTERDVYIGEAEDVLERLKRHVADKDFWHEVLIFTSKDQNLTKSHVKYLESRLVAKAKQAQRYCLRNDNRPARAGLPQAHQDAMEELLVQVPLLLGVLGHRVLDPVASVSSSPTGQLKFMCEVKGAKARGTVTDEGFVVFKGSTALKGTTKSMTAGWRALKNELSASGKLTEKDSALIFTADVLFNSPSAAAAVVYGNSANGRLMWKTEDGRTLKDVEESATLLEPSPLPKPSSERRAEAKGDAAAGGAKRPLCTYAVPSQHGGNFPISDEHWAALVARLSGKVLFTAAELFAAHEAIMGPRGDKNATGRREWQGRFDADLTRWTRAKRVARRDGTVLIRNETRTGTRPRDP